MYRLNTKIRLTMQFLSGFELYSRWVPLFFSRVFFGREEKPSEYQGKGAFAGKEVGVWNR